VFARQRRARRRRADRAGVRRTPVRRLHAPARRRPRRACSASDRSARPAPRHRPQGSGRTVLARRRRQGRGRSGAAASTSSARRCTRSAYRPPGRWRPSAPARWWWRDSRSRRAADRVAASHVRVGTFQFSPRAARMTWCARWRTT
jgi:hypothetical protein